MESKKYFQTKTALFMHFSKGSRIYFAGAIVFACLVTFLDMINPKIISFTIDHVIGKKAITSATFTSKLVLALGNIDVLRQNLWKIGLLMVGIALLAAVFRYLFRLPTSISAETFVEHTRNEIYQKLQHLPLSWFEDYPTGELLQRSTSDIEAIKMFLSEQLTNLVRIVILIVFSLAFMAQIDWKMTLGVVAFSSVVILYSTYFHKKIAEWFEKAEVEESRLSSVAQENLTGVRVVRAFGKESYESKRFENKNEEYTNLWIHIMRLLSAFWCSGDIISYSQVLFVLALGAVHCVNGTMTAGEFIAFALYNNMLIWPIRMLGRVISQLSKFTVAMDRLLEIMNGEEEKDVLTAGDTKADGDIVFDHVTFEYGTHEVLHDVSFRIPAHSTFGILGGTGSGKSTVGALLTKQYPLEKGTITIGGKNIQELSNAVVRNSVGMVLQEPYLFSRTLKENITICNPNASTEEISRVTQEACLTETIEHFSKGYDTFVGERGVTLSGGQKQRTAIAQMLLRNTPIQIFDDSLSAVDSQTDYSIRKALKENEHNTTTVLIAHRISTLMHADFIIVLDRGRIAESGNHKELLNQNGIYRRIYDMQNRGRVEF